MVAQGAISNPAAFPRRTIQPRIAGFAFPPCGFSTSLLKEVEGPQGLRDEPCATLKQVSGDHTGGVTPVPIPTTEVKPSRAHGTARVTVRESRSSPGLIFLYRRLRAGTPTGSHRRARFASGNLDRGADSLLDTVNSKSGVPIRLTDERWAHITEEHCELVGLRPAVLETIGNPLRILAGGAGELLAVREGEAGKWLVVVYRELGDDGFVITAFLTRRMASLERRKQVWP